MSGQYNIAIVGATGAVGKTILSILEERHFPVDKLYLLASERSAGTPMTFCDHTIIVENLAEFDFSKVSLALFSAGGAISAKYAPKAAKAGCVVIDNTSHFRYDPEIPLVVPEVNSESIADYVRHGIIANPNCSTIQMVVALKPIHDLVGIQRINVATYQAVSGAGARAVDELSRETIALLNCQPHENTIFPQQMAFNVLPQIDVFQENGYTKEEMKMVWETRKLLNDESINVNPTAVRVPVFYGHSEAIHVETRDKITAAQAREVLMNAPGVVVMDDPLTQTYPTPVSEATGRDAVFVGRIREDISHPTGLNLWVVSDNIRKGAALNAVQIAELMIKYYLD